MTVLINTELAVREFQPCWGEKGGSDPYESHLTCFSRVWSLLLKTLPLGEDIDLVEVDSLLREPPWRIGDAQWLEHRLAPLLGESWRERANVRITGLGTFRDTLPGEDGYVYDHGPA
jgi:hypothetical protein